MVVSGGTVEVELHGGAVIIGHSSSGIQSSFSSRTYPGLQIHPGVQGIEQFPVLLRFSQVGSHPVQLTYIS